MWLGKELLTQLSAEELFWNDEKNFDVLLNCMENERLKLLSGKLKIDVSEKIFLFFFVMYL